MGISDEAKEFINEEIATLDGVLDSLKKQREYGSERLQTENERARALTSRLVATRRVEDRAMLASDEAVSHALKDKKHSEIKILGKLIERPYFARIVLEEQQNGQPKQIEYKLGLSANPDCRIIDWRKAPISKLYYEYKEGDEYSEEILGRERNGRVTLRNTVEIERGSLKKISCRHGTFTSKDGDWSESAERLARKQGSATGQLPEILSLITADQFKTITEDAETAILIQGIAGSGKTTVALHRLAWLLHEDNSDLEGGRSLVIVLSNALKSYVSGTLPSMGIQGSEVLTLPEFAARTIVRIAPQLIEKSGAIRRPIDRCPASIERVKKSMALLNALEAYVGEQRKALIEEFSLSLPWADIPVEARKSFDHSLKCEAPICSLLSDLSGVLDHALANLREGDSRLGSIYATLCILDERAKDLRDYEADLLALLDRPDKLLEHDETKLLDESIIEAAYNRTESNRQICSIDPCDDALLLRLCELKTGALYLEDGSSGRYDHIVVDEVQDFSPADIASIIGGVSDARNLTLVGDIAQQIDGQGGFPGWEKLRRHWDFKDSMSKYISLTVSHRSTLQIMRLAEHIQTKSVVSTGRQGRVPIWFKCSTESKGVENAIKWLGTAIERYPNALTAVICKDDREARFALSLLQPSFGPVVRIGDASSFSFDQGIIVTDIKQVKGLEFQNVLIWNPSAKSYPPDQLSRNLLYVAITRAEENLCLVSWGKPSEVLPSVHSSLVRGMTISADEQDDVA